MKALRTAATPTRNRRLNEILGLVVLGAYLSDALLQVLGVAVFLFPLLLVRLGVCWLRSRAVGAAMANWAGLMLWVFFAPAAIALLPDFAYVILFLPMVLALVFKPEGLFGRPLR